MIVFTAVRVVTQQERWPHYWGLVGLPQNTFRVPLQGMPAGKEEPHLSRAVCMPRKLPKCCWALRRAPHPCRAAQPSRWRGPGAIPPGFFSQLSLMSYSPELGNCFLWDIVSAIIKLQEQQKKEKHGSRERDTGPFHRVHAHKQQPWKPA